MNNQKNKNTMILIAILVAVCAVLYKNMFAPVADSSVAGSLSSSGKTDEALQKIETINFDMAVFNDPKFGTFQSIETTLPSIPAGKVNPFASVLGR